MAGGLQTRKASAIVLLTLAYQSFGVVYGDLSVSSLYVFRSTFGGKLSSHVTEGEIYGVLSFIFWTLTLVPLVKYCFVVLSADDNGEGAILHYLCFFHDRFPVQTYCSHTVFGIHLESSSCDSRKIDGNSCPPHVVGHGMHSLCMMSSSQFSSLGIECTLNLVFSKEFMETCCFLHMWLDRGNICIVFFAVPSCEAELDFEPTNSG